MALDCACLGMLEMAGNNCLVPGMGMEPAFVALTTNYSVVLQYFLKPFIKKLNVLFFFVFFEIFIMKV